METQQELLPKGKITPKKTFDPVFIPDDVYEAVIRTIEPIDTEYGHTLVFSFQITEGQHKDKIVDGLCSVNFNEGSKLKSWTEAILKKELHVNDEIDVNTLVGMKARILVGHKDKIGRDGKPFKQSGAEKVL